MNTNAYDTAPFGPWIGPGAQAVHACLTPGAREQHAERSTAWLLWALEMIRWVSSARKRAPPLRAYERIADGEPREAAEVAVRRPQRADAVMLAQRGDPRVVNLRACDTTRRERPPKLVPV